MRKHAPENNHPLHGQLANDPYKEYQFIGGEDNKGNYIELKGRYHYKVAFSYNYIAEPSVRIYENATTFHINMKFKNLLSKPLRYMYLMHINFNLVQESEIISTVSDEADKVTIRKNPNYLKSEKYNKFIDEVTVSP